MTTRLHHHQTPARAWRRSAGCANKFEASAADPLACITSAEATGQLYAEAAAFAAAPPVVRRGDRIDLASFAEKCLTIGYVTDDRIDEPGEIGVRGGVVDIFPVDQGLPVRIEVEDEVAVSIRSFDPVDQLTVKEFDQVAIGRASEPDPTGGVTLLAHLSGGALVEESRVAARRKSFLALASDAERFGRPARTVVDAARWAKESAAFDRLDWSQDDADPLPRFVESRAPLAALERLAKPILAEGGVLIVAGSARDLRFLRPKLAKRFRCEIETLGRWADVHAAKPGTIVAIEAPADVGFRCGKLLVVAAADLLGSRAVITDATPIVGSLDLQNVAELHVGDVVVHEDHGIARLLGTDTLPGPDDSQADAIALAFAGETKRLIPATEADKLWRYGGESDAVSLDKLDGSSWQKRRGDIDAALAESAKALIALANERERNGVAPIVPDQARYEKFVSGFNFTETPDQARAIDAVRADLASGKPMDRLVIGDVGYGKTEIALRAAAMVALSGGQVVLAAPTTVLVRQHLQLFERRFAEFGIKVAGLSRLSSAAEKKETRAGLVDGTIGIVIGTAATAGKGIAYQNLQLVVVDEEQRFGAADKTKLRDLHNGHVLTLSATPIPRTLQSALVGLQQMSVIATPPARRQPIRTTVDSWDDTRVRTALMRERARRGQSFVVVSRIEDMVPLSAKLAKIFPEGDIIEAHGKMPADALDAAMIDFASGRGDVLLATNIIEAGLDIPRANTMIVWRADRFGLSQLHQLRGRVGRGSRRGQIWLLTDGGATIAEATLKRLKTLQAFDRLGAGFGISARDLDMRGAGDLLSDSQTGHMRLIGVDLYQHMLKQALRTSRGETVDLWQPQLNLGLSGSIPEDWLSEPDLRIQLYARLARLNAPTEIDTFEDELSDRFGELPPLVRALIATARLRVLARAVGVARIDAGAAAIALTPRDRTKTSDWSAEGLTQSGDRYLLNEPIADAQQRADRLASVLEAFL